MKKEDCYLVLDNIRSALNVGSIIRTSEASGVEKIYFCGITPDTSDQKVLKTSLGAEKTLETEYKKTTIEAVNELKEAGFQIVSLEQSQKSEDFRKTKYSYPVCLIVGNEVSGVSDEILKISDKIVEIPMRGKKNSLNVSVATGIALYEILK